MVAITVTKLTPGTKPMPPSGPKTSLRGSAGALFAGPLAGVDGAATAGPATPTHATGVAAGGVEESTGSRRVDSYLLDGGTSGVSGTVLSNTDTRPTGRTRYFGDGVQGGSLPGRPIASGTDHVLSGGGYATGTFDKRTGIDGEGGRALGASGKGSSVAAETVSIKTSKLGTGTLDRPPAYGAADPAAGTIGIVDGTGGVMQVDFNAADITGGSAGRAGALITVWTRDTDTDCDKTLLGVFVADGGTDITTLFTPGAGTYAVYTAWRYLRKDGGFSYGPFSARQTKVIT